MGAVALIGLLVGGPLGVCFALAYGVVAVLKVGKVDAQYAARGETPPTYRLIEKWLDGRKARGQAPKGAKPAKYGAWRYAWQRWQAMWELLADEHRARHEQEKRARADAREKGLPVPKRPPLWERLAQLKAWRWTVDKVIAPVGEKKAATVAVDQAAPSPNPVPEGPRTACEDCGQTLTSNDGQWVHPSSAGCPTARKSNPAPRPDPTEQANPQSGVDAASGSEADDKGKSADLNAALQWRLDWLATPESRRRPDESDVDYKARLNAKFAELSSATNRWNGTTEGETMTATTQSGEVTGVRSAITYATAMAEAHQAHAGNEGYLTSLANMEVGPEDVSAAQAAMEASQNAAALWAAHAKGLADHNSAVAEAYATSPSAANKQAQINE